MTDVERKIVIALARKHGIDARFLAALQQTENGPTLADGSQGFGVLAVTARETFHRNGEWAARTVRRCIGRFVMANAEIDFWWDEYRARYSTMFIRYFSRGGEGYPGYAPLGAENDPTGLNAHHFDNLIRFYTLECDEAEEDPV